MGWIFGMHFRLAVGDDAHIVPYGSCDMVRTAKQAGQRWYRPNRQSGRWEATEQVQRKVALPARDDVGIVPYGKFVICPIAVAAQEGSRATVQ